MSEEISSYPLTWPHGWPRTGYRQDSRYGDRSIDKAVRELLREVQLLGGKDEIISTNIKPRLDGLPSSSDRQPNDPGAALYFKLKGKSMCFACDRWKRVVDNIWAIVLTISAIRQINRSGSSDMMERAFTGFLALPAPPSDGLDRPWWEILGFKTPPTDPNEIERRYLELRKKAHPDAGGSHEEFLRITTAYEQWRSE